MRRDHAGAGDRRGGCVRFARVELTELEVDGVEAAYSVDGPPGLAVVAAALGAFGSKPDLVVFGVNAGINRGQSVVHSGTVGAALTARTVGSHGLAVSVDASDPWHWETAIAIALSAVDWVLGHASPRAVLNLTAPALPLSEVRGIRWADLDESGHLRVAVADLPGSRLEYDVRGSASGLYTASDTALCFDGYATGDTAVAG